MVDDIEDKELDDAVDAEHHTAIAEWLVMQQRWADRAANPFMVTTVFVSNLLLLMRQFQDKEGYDSQVRNILAAVEEQVKQSKDDNNARSRDVH